MIRGEKKVYVYPSTGCVRKARIKIRCAHHPTAFLCLLARANVLATIKPISDVCHNVIPDGRNTYVDNVFFKNLLCECTVEKHRESGALESSLLHVVDELPAKS